jgi:single-stranded-DNA-specific exonuclease
LETKWRAAKRWVAAEVDGALSARIARELGCSALLADLLVRRGVGTPEEADVFLHPRLQHLEDPESLPGIEAAVARIASALERSEPIAVFGDYDVDGLASTALLLEFFRFLGVSVRHYIPSRLDEGYGMNLEAVRRLARDGIRLVITVDNGSSAVDEIELARELGMDVVVTDHHLPSDPLPRPAALVNPCLPGSPYPFPHLAGAGVTFKLVWQICRHFSRSRKVSEEFKGFMLEALAFVALGTISDVVPLRGENRILARFGLNALENTRLPGPAALVRLALGESGGRRLAAADVAFRIGPCINSAGRLGEAELALRLLTTRDAAEAEALVKRLASENDRRRRIEKDIHRQAREQVIRSMDPEVDRALVLAGEGWHPGVIGIVAARLVEEFYRPTFIIALDGEVGKGSARSIPQVQIREALEKARGCLQGFGGHAQAAGLRVAADRIGELRALLNQAIEVAPDAMVPEVETDGDHDLAVWTPERIRELDQLAPFGQGNREPLFACRGLEVAGAPRLLGKDASHLSFLVRHPQGVLRAVAFGKAGMLPALSRSGARVSLVYQPVINRWRDSVSVELLARELDVAASSS